MYIGRQLPDDTEAKKMPQLGRHPHKSNTPGKPSPPGIDRRPLVGDIVKFILATLVGYFYQAKLVDLNPRIFSMVFGDGQPENSKETMPATGGKQAVQRVDAEDMLNDYESEPINLSLNHKMASVKRARPMQKRRGIRRKDTVLANDLLRMSMEEIWKKEFNKRQKAEKRLKAYASKGGQKQSVLLKSPDQSNGSELFKGLQKFLFWQASGYVSTALTHYTFLAINVSV